MKRGFILLFFAINLLSGQATAQTESVNVRAWIETEIKSEKNKTEIRGMITNESAQEVTLYHRLEVIKTGPGGTSRHNSNGSFTVAPKETRTVARSNFSSTSATSYQVKFRILNDLGEIFFDSLHSSPTAFTNINEQLPATNTPAPPTVAKQNKQTAPPAEKNNAESVSPLLKMLSTPKAVTKVPVDVLEIDGLIIDETRSKIARDFYDLFYKKWIPPAGASNFSIFVREAPSRGRGARVSLTLNEQKIFENFVPPRYDALEEVVNFAIRIARARLNTQKNIKQQLNEEDQMGSGI